MTFYRHFVCAVSFGLAVSTSQCVTHAQQVPGQQTAAQQQVPAQQVSTQQATTQQQAPGASTPAGPGIPIVPAADAVKQGNARVAQAPWPPLSPQYQSFVDQVLQVWEQRTDDIKTYQCELSRWQFNPAFFAGGYYTHGTGTLRFQDPGKAEFKIEKIEQLTQKEPPKYAVNPREPHGEHWICDGQWVHILDQNRKQATRIQLPPSYRDEKVYQSPLPFVFGVKAQELKDRYWIRPLISQKDDEVWLEAVPKRADDAANYSRVQIVLDKKDTLPKGLIVFMPNWTEKQPHREVFQFNNRQTNMMMANMRQALFNQAFIPTKLGNDWKVDEQPYIPPQPQGTQPGRVAAPQMQVPTRR